MIPWHAPRATTGDELEVGIMNDLGVDARTRTTSMPSSPTWVPPKAEAIN